MKAVILAGGRSLRMGTDKSLLEIGGVTLIEIISKMLSRLFDEVIISGSAAKYGFLPYRIVEDRITDCGPMGGIFSCLDAVQEDLFFCSCDMPFLSERLLDQFLAQSKAGDLHVASYETRVFPTLAIYPFSMAAAIAARLQENNYRLWDFVIGQQANIISFDSSFARDFQNLNTPEEFAEALRNFI